MQNPVTKLGIIRSITYFPDRQRLRATTAEGNVHEVHSILPQRVDAARPFTATRIERLVDESLPWRLVSGKPQTPPKRIVATPPRVKERGGKRMAGRFLSPLGLVQSVTYDRSSERLRLTLADGGCFESRRVTLEAARSLAPVRTRDQFDRLFGVGQEWRRRDESA